jgi:hypothetical protein
VSSSQTLGSDARAQCHVCTSLGKIPEPLKLHLKLGLHSKRREASMMRGLNLAPTSGQSLTPREVGNPVGCPRQACTRSRLPIRSACGQSLPCNQWSVLPGRSAERLRGTPLHREEKHQLICPWSVTRLSNTDRILFTNQVTLDRVPVCPCACVSFSSLAAGSLQGIHPYLTLTSKSH